MSSRSGEASCELLYSVYLLPLPTASSNIMYTGLFVVVAFVVVANNVHVFVAG